MRGKKTLVTGADGFIGSHLVEGLVAAGADVRALVYYNSWNAQGWLADLPGAIRAEIEIVQGDVRDPARMRALVAGCDYVFHLASLIAIPYSYEAPDSYVATNIGGTLNILQACRDSDRLVRLVHVSTSEVYGTAQQVPIAEAHPLVGQSPYSASKIGADKMAESFHLSFGLPVVTARPFNTFGPRQTARAVIPTIAAQLLAGTPELTLGALTPTRDFNFATDTAAGMIALGGCGAAEGQVVNIGSGEEWSIEQTARMLMEIIGRQVPIACAEERLRPEKSEVNRLLADTTRIAALTGWRRAVPFREGLERTAEWIGRNIRLFEPERYQR
ncbi:NAD-dependent dehydratase [Oceanibaculum pacificum]|uniref:NAD-dependent dehydratase n=1 Tax=Oceanibaculum pacificum TaxID=580166 RepID=A0A154WFE7_9PROT|nr:NAD-dependent dehydratase [Oceanibaculum pacificum]